MKKLIYFLSFISTILFCSCESEMMLDCTVSNSTASTIHVMAYDSIHNIAIDTTIQSGIQATLVSWSKLGKSSVKVPVVDLLGNHVVVLNTLGDTLKKDILNDANWTKVVEEQRYVANHFYRFDILDSDF
ncbi:MAG: hypothetical protein R2831_09575 [Chitinophagaceae bacterium]